MARRRRVWRIVGVGMGPLCHDGEVEGVVVEDDAVLVLGIRGRAMLKRMSQNDVAPIVFHECFRAGCCDMRNLSASLVIKLMHSWGFALREGVFAETKEGKTLLTFTYFSNCS